MQGKGYPIAMQPHGDRDDVAAVLFRSGDHNAAFAVWEELEQGGTASLTYPGLIEDLLRGDGFDLAVDLLDEGARRLPLSARSALRRTLRCAQWLAQEGHRQEAGMLIDRLAGGEGEIWLRRKLACIYFAQFTDDDPARMAMLPGWVARRSPQLLIDKILSLLASKQEMTAEFHAVVNRCLVLAPDWKPPKRRYVLKSIAHYLLIRGETERLARFAEMMPEDLAEVAAENDLLAGWLRDRLVKAGQPVPDPPLHRAAEVFDLFEQGTARLLARFADPDCRIAVVGNSPCELGLGKGPEIDAHDLIVRFNNAPFATGHVADYGARMHVHVMGAGTFRITGSVLAQVLASTDPAERCQFFWRSGSRSTDLRQDRIDGLKGFDMGVVRTPPQHYSALKELLNAGPSSGLQVLYTLYRTRGSLNNVNTYGFSLVDQIDPNVGSSNYYRNAIPAVTHNWQGEAALLAALKAGTEPTPQPSISSVEPPRRSPRSRFRPLRLRLIGDHAHYHCGSAAVTDQLTGMLGKKGVLVSDDNYDVLVVNGEGTMHHDRKGHIAKMKAIARAQKLGRITMLVNSVWQQNDDRFDDVLRRLDFIAVREVLSQRDLMERHEIRASVFPDMSYNLTLGAPERVVDCQGGLAVTDFYAREFGQFVRLTGGPLNRDATFLSMQELDWSSLVHSLKTARLLVTGRHHAVYAACRAEIPFVAVPGNTHKIEGLIASAGVDIPLCKDPRKLRKAIQRALDDPQPYRDLFAWLREQPPCKIPGHLMVRTADGRNG